MVLKNLSRQPQQHFKNFSVSIVAYITAFAGLEEFHDPWMKLSVLQKLTKCTKWLPKMESRKSKDLSVWRRKTLFDLLRNRAVSSRSSDGGWSRLRYISMQRDFPWSERFSYMRQMPRLWCALSFLLGGMQLSWTLWRNFYIVILIQKSFLEHIPRLNK